MLGITSSTTDTFGNVIKSGKQSLELNNFSLIFQDLIQGLKVVYQSTFDNK